jgi:hypothetical protein
MKKDKRFFNISNYFFWIVLSCILFLLLPYFKNGFYNHERIETWLSQFDTITPIIEDDSFPEPDPSQDTNKIKNSDTLFQWRWRDFNGKFHQIKFKFEKNGLRKATQFRSNAAANYNIYSDLYQHDKKYLKDIISEMKRYIKSEDLNYIDALNYVCSSIQYIPYTLVLTSDGNCPCEQPFGSFSANCKVQKDGRGCCEGVDPFGLYSPLEFACYRTGDCDTRALLAYTFLKEMGFDVAVMVSDRESHSVLGVSIPSIPHTRYSYGTNYSGKKYFLWELTSENWRFGMPVEGNDWIATLE